MRILSNELKKFLNPKLLLLLAILAALFHLTFLSNSIDQFERLQSEGVYGSFQTEMFEKYGSTLEPEELAEFDVDGRIEEQEAAFAELIAANQRFEEYDISNYEDWEIFQSQFTVVRAGDSAVGILPGGDTFTNGDPEELERTYNDMYTFLIGLDSQTIVMDIYSSPLLILQSLETVKRYYVDVPELSSFSDLPELTGYIENGQRPVVDEAAQEIRAIHNNSLIAYHIPGDFAGYSALVAAFSIFSVLMLVCPIIANDRRRSIHLLAYSSKTGRKVFAVQFMAVITMALILSVVFTVVSWIPYVNAGAFAYWDTPMMGISVFGMSLADVTFGQYALLLALASILISITAAGAAFLLSRFSPNSVIALIKAVPTGAALVIVTFVIFLWFGYAQNAVFHILDQWFHIYIRFPESWFAVVPAAAMLIICVFLVRKERRVDVL